jgi:hypothetical protein
MGPQSILIKLSRSIKICAIRSSFRKFSLNQMKVVLRLEERFIKAVKVKEELVRDRLQIIRLERVQTSLRVALKVWMKVNDQSNI